MTAIQPIDKKFLEDAIGEPISDFTVGAGCKAGDNIAGSLKAITVKTKSNQEHHLVFKRFPEEMTQENNFVVTMKAFWRENSIYKTVLPMLEKYAKSRGVEWTVPVPKYLKGYNDDLHDYILMEDVRPSGYKMPDKTVSLSLEETSLILTEFAKFHAISYAFMRHEGKRIFEEVDGFQYLVQDEGMKQMIETSFVIMVKLFFCTAADCLESRFPEGAVKMKKFMEDTGKMEWTMEHLTDVELFPTLCHFDLWSNNIFIKHNDKDLPVGVKFIDFQMTQKGNIFTDLLYTLYTSTTPEFRKLHLNTVLGHYYDEFCSTLDKMNIPMPWGFTRGFLFDQFNVGIATAFVRMTVAIPLQLGTMTKTEKKEGEENDLLHSQEGIKKMYEESPEAMQRLEELVREMIERKIFK